MARFTLMIRGGDMQGQAEQGVAWRGKVYFDDYIRGLSGTGMAR